MAIRSELERYDEWRSTFTLSEEGPYTFQQLEKVREIDGVVWGDNGWSDSEKLTRISEILSR
ncbi:hypothetical protein SEA_JACKO_75 [Microbacterium phage Jacko]|nr:hypothetical protein SEA_JACKO_75 [Microbacterium phage Jacko]